MTMHTIKNVQIFKVGKWNGDSYSRDDLEDMRTNFYQVGFAVPVKLGHSERSGDMAYGWVANLKLESETLVADFTDVGDELYGLIRDRRFDAVSAEIYWNLERNGRKFRRVLKAAALLGAETPGVSHLAPLRTVVNQDNGTYERLAACSLAIGSEVEQPGMNFWHMVGDFKTKNNCTNVDAILAVSRTVPGTEALRRCSDTSQAQTSDMNALARAPSDSGRCDDDLDPSQEVHNRALKVLAAGYVGDYTKAAQLVLQQDPELRRRYAEGR